MEPVSIGGMIKTIMDWLIIPFTMLLSILGFQFKKTLERVEKLEAEIKNMEIQVAKTEVYIQSLRVQLERVDYKLDKVLERLADEKRK